MVHIIANKHNINKYSTIAKCYRIAVIYTNKVQNKILQRYVRVAFRCNFLLL